MASFNIVVFESEMVYFQEPLNICLSVLRSLGHEVKGSSRIEDGIINIVFSPQSFTNWRKIREMTTADNIIVYNFEPASTTHCVRFTLDYLSVLVNSHVWDYNLDNVKLLQSSGIQDIHHLPVGFDEVLVFDENHTGEQVFEDIDVLFYGATNSYRQSIIESIRATGLNVVTNEGRHLEESEKIALIRRSKLVLNLHAFDPTSSDFIGDFYPFELVRASLLLANKKAVVAVTYGNTSIEEDIENAVLCVSPEHVAQTCFDLVHDETRRRAVEQNGFDVFSKRKARDLMKVALARFFEQREMKKLGNQADIRTFPLRHLYVSELPWQGHGMRFTQTNMRAQAKFLADIALSIDDADFANKAFDSWRFGVFAGHELKNYFESIHASDVFVFVDDPMMALKNCLYLLQESGRLHISVPHDLASNRAADVRIKRVLNLAQLHTVVSDNWLLLSDGEHRLTITGNTYAVLQSQGLEWLAANDNNWDTGLKTEGVVDCLNVYLQKTPLTDEEKKEYAAVFDVF